VSKEETDRIANTLTARSAILDFYSDRATSFASFFVASIFGLVTMLTIVQGINQGGAYGNPSYYGFLIVISIVVYIVFAYAGRYIFKRFAHYADIADKLVFEPRVLNEESETIQKSLFNIAELEKLKWRTQLEGESNLKKYREKTSKVQHQLFAKKALRCRFDLIYSVLVVLLGTLVFLPKIVDILLLIFPCLPC
jgi:hypothetical protein